MIPKPNMEMLRTPNCNQDGGSTANRVSVGLPLRGHFKARAWNLLSRNLAASDAGEPGWSLRSQSVGKLEEKLDPKKLLIDVDRVRRGGGSKLGPIFSAFHICGLRAKWIRFDRTKKGWHIVVFLDMALTPAETIALEVVCGSDRRRANLDLMRVLAMRKHGASKFWQARSHILYSGKLETARILRRREGGN